MRWTFAAILAMLMAETALAGRPELIVDIDFNDEVDRRIADALIVGDYELCSASPGLLDRKGPDTSCRR